MVREWFGFDMKKFYTPFFLLFSIALASAGIPQVSNISYSQRIDQNGSRTKLVDIQYDLDGNRSMYVEFFFSHDGGSSFPVICSAMSGAAGADIQAGSSKNATWDASVDWDKNFTSQGRIMIKATYSDQPTGFPGLDGNGTINQPFHVVELNDTIDLEMIWVEPGTFTMGSPVGETGRSTNETEHNVTLTKGFYLGKYEVTQAQWEAVMAGNTVGLSATLSSESYHPNRPIWGDNSNNGVGYIIFGLTNNYDPDPVAVFLRRLNDIGRNIGSLPNGWEYVLPTEAEWEYACRAGTSTAFFYGDDFNASYGDIYMYNLPEEVGSYPANPWGFHDMHANVFELVADWSTNEDYSSDPVVDPTGPSEPPSPLSELRGTRSGGRSASRLMPGGGENTGLRIALKHTGKYVAELNSTVDLEMIWVEPGTFTMGSPETEVGRYASYETQYQVTLTKGFYLGKYEVTQAQYEAVMTGNSEGLSAAPNGTNYPNRPVERVSWNDIQVFLTRLNQSESTNTPAEWAYVLPTEAQWEYACRAGTTTPYSWGNDINASLANYNLNIWRAEAVGQYPANPWGFFDMHGNIQEWTADWFSPHFSSTWDMEDPFYVEDPVGYTISNSNTNIAGLRGGNWGEGRERVRSASRRNYSLGYTKGNTGFRLALQRQ